MFAVMNVPGALGSAFAKPVESSVGHAKLVTVAAKSKKRATASKRRKKAAPKVSREQVELAHTMVRNAYQLSRTLPTERRVSLLTRLLYTLPADQMADEKKQWAEELFSVAQTLPERTTEVDSARDAAVATAAARLAIYDPDRALELLDSLPQRSNDVPDPRVMAARLVFPIYVRHRGAEGANVLLDHARRWSQTGAFPYSASSVVLSRLLARQPAAEDFFDQCYKIFQQGREGVFGVADFTSFVQQAEAMHAVPDAAAKSAAVTALQQLTKWHTANADLLDSPAGANAALSMQRALANIKLLAPEEYAEARRSNAEMFQVAPQRARNAALRRRDPAVDTGLQEAHRSLAAVNVPPKNAQDINEDILKGLTLINQRYQTGECADCKSPDAQSWAFVSLAANASPMTVGNQLAQIKDPFWRAYFLAIAAQQVAMPTPVVDPTARQVAAAADEDE